MNKYLTTFASEVTEFSPSAVDDLGKLRFNQPNDCDGACLSIRFDMEDFKAPPFFQDHVSRFSVELCGTDICPVLVLRKGFVAQSPGDIYLFNRLVHIDGSWGLIGLQSSLKRPTGCRRAVVQCSDVIRVD